MKRLIIVLLTLAMSINMIGCGSSRSVPAPPIPVPAPTYSQTARVNNIYATVVRANGISNAPALVIVSNSAINAQEVFELGVISINTGLIDSALDDSEIAMVLGHELAHFTKGDSMSTIPIEYAADQLGGQYMAKAGYNLCLGAKIIQRFGTTASSDHPAGTDRYARLGCS